MTYQPHELRLELITTWEAYLGGRLSRAAARDYIDERLAFYGPEELVHDGLQLLNDAVNAGDHASAEGKERAAVWYAAWSRECEIHDADPVAWRRRWAIAYLKRLLPKIRPASRPKAIAAFREDLTDADVESLSIVATSSEA
ncbi:hypothetical protein AX769_09825 [Frondihabitans sp. PAMC 28766]|uniref:hypothetical protein n=1 Tax=Frondihabitans sp. PAMC 28766 TaxID=1795630 RepID=UPI00078B64DB|nr:hypothetical protein [Frondihabitans sp. PAMC 28766]AMM20391.1 hypothetical protein AX769_09825 [Frondihabitans sp. PAMC 28766]